VREAWRWLEPVLGEAGEVVDQPVEFLHLDKWEFKRRPLPPQWALKARGISKKAAEALVIRWDDSYGDDGAFMLPAWHPVTHELIGWQWKPVDGDARTHRGTRTGQTLFGLPAVADYLPIILVESPLDVAVLWPADEKNGLASFGRDVSRHQRQLLGDIARRGRKQLLLALDDDNAGWAAHDSLVVSKELRGVRKRTFNYAVAAENAPATDRAKDVGELDDHEIIAGIKTSLTSKPGLRTECGRPQKRSGRASQ
jgi:hypothetical protein